MSSRMDSILSDGRVAVITGAAAGLGAALATRLAQKGMKLALFDRDEEKLQALAHTLPIETLTRCGDASSMEDLEAFHTATIDRFGAIHLLINNVGMMKPAGPWDSPAEWRQGLDVNFTSALAMQHLFVPAMIAANAPAAIVNLGSKEGITTPPGNACYSVAKAAIKVLTEQLEHEVRSTTGGRVSAHLFVPGYTWTPMNAAQKPAGSDKPTGAWTSEQTVDYFLARLHKEDFYILCPDGEVTPDMDARRMRWAVEDLIFNRPALSRWHPNFKEAFEKWMKA
ncbi:SDR family NAD(P)-dependent oxidoreductase [uncultured Cohaesibacter sp.]|uniref:SDR family NAD(P)-dependent oxidoreductase n=1 Tax=uncultured Cohaesibacter sp. TaxID=1002546 RepID=UPI0029C697D2|nr:SDR family NAD(P)-dependent oxidoreductase [uncultured Cohaesibacter sp.]